MTGIGRRRSDKGGVAELRIAGHLNLERQAFRRRERNPAEWRRGDRPRSCLDPARFYRRSRASPRIGYPTEDRLGYPSRRRGLPQFARNQNVAQYGPNWSPGFAGRKPSNSCAARITDSIGGAGYPEVIDGYALVVNLGREPTNNLSDASLGVVSVSLHGLHQLRWLQD